VLPGPASRAGLRARTMRKYGAIRVSATSGWAAAVASSARGSATASMIRPAARTAVSQLASVRRAYVIVNGRCLVRSPDGPAAKLQVSVTGPWRK